jgi:hypothetical protein
LKGTFLARLVFLPSVLAIPDEVIEQSFRNASIDGGEVTSRVIQRHAEVFVRCPFLPIADIAARL